MDSTDIKTLDMDALTTRIHEMCKEKRYTHTKLAKISGVNINTINSWFRKNETDAFDKKKNNTPKIDNLYQIAQALGVSLDYLVSGENRHIGNKEMSEFTGLSDTAIECLRGWHEDQQDNFIGNYRNDIETLNFILEYYGKIRRKNDKKGMVSGFSIFHFIGNFIHADKFKRQQQDWVRYGNGKEYKTLETGDTIIKKDSKQKDIVTEVCCPISSKTYTGTNIDQVNLFNSENEKESYNIPVAAIYKEHCKSQIIKSIEKISSGK